MSIGLHIRRTFLFYRYLTRGMVQRSAVPGADDLWRGIGGHFDTFTQIMCEFIDNSISHMTKHRTQFNQILIHIHEVEHGVSVTLEDTGPGIEDLGGAMRLGDRSGAAGPMNEHGFGMKHALASANPSNDNWVVFTRSETEKTAGTHRTVSYPYSFDFDDEMGEEWPGSFNTSGTIVKFTCNAHLFDTVRQGIPGTPRFSRKLEYFVEDLGFVYAGVISAGTVTIRVKSSDDFDRAVAAVEPQWEGYYQPAAGDRDIDLGGGNLRLYFEFGEMKDSSHTKYYRRNISTSGVEIRINGRLMVYNLFKEIWNIEKHNTYNHLLVRLNLMSDDLANLPRTRTSKNGLRIGDEKLEKLFEWIRSVMPTPPKQLSRESTESDLLDKLKRLKELTRDQDKIVEREFPVFDRLNSGVKADLYFYDGRERVLYEGKKNSADLQDLYQLLMYWDGAVCDAWSPDEGILIASDFAPGVSEIVEELNARTDQNGNKYKFVLRRWTDEGVKYPV